MIVLFAIQTRRGDRTPIVRRLGGLLGGRTSRKASVGRQVRRNSGVVPGRECGIENGANFVSLKEHKLTEDCCRDAGGYGIATALGGASSTRRKGGVIGMDANSGCMEAQLLPIIWSSRFR